MSVRVARENLERSYKIMVDSQNTYDKQWQLDAAMHVIVAWEAISHEVTVMAQERIDAIEAKALTRAQ